MEVISEQHKSEEEVIRKLQSAHSGHFGVITMVMKIRDKGWNLKQSVNEDYVESCPVCQRFKKYILNMNGGILGSTHCLDR